jgi:hypothetical protein
MNRATGWTRVANAGSYIVYAFNNRTNAVNATADTAAELAVAWSVVAQPETGNIAGDVRTMTFEGPATRTLPEGFTPAGIGASSPANGTVNGAYTTNLVPDQYWIRVMAVPSDPATHVPSNLSNVHTAAQTFNIAMGPCEARALIESRFDELGTTLHIRDVRPLTEAGDEGSLRYTHSAGSAFTQTTADTVLLAPFGGDTSRRGEITVLQY